MKCKRITHKSSNFSSSWMIIFDMNLFFSFDSSSSSLSQFIYFSHFLRFIELLDFSDSWTNLIDSICLEILMLISSSGNCFPSFLISDCLIVDLENMILSFDYCVIIFDDFGIFISIMIKEKIKLMFWDILLSMILIYSINEKINELSILFNSI